MKFPRSVTIAVLLGLISASLPAITLPVSEDSYATRTTGKNPRFVLAPNAGRASQLHVTKNHVALVRFNVGALGEGLPASEVDRALLMIHISSASRPESVWIHRVTADWTEASSAAGLAPSFDATYVAEIQADYLVSDQFVLIDVTDLVKDWLTDPASDFGVCLSTTGKCQVRVGSKERPASGYPAVLQIERVRVVGNAHLAPGIDATKLGTGSVDNTELGFLDGVTSVIQPRLDELGGDLDLVAAEVDGKVSKSGDIMSGALQLPADGLVVGGNQLTVAAGGVGIGTNTPGAKLDVRGDVKLGPSGQFQAPASEERLRIVRGTIVNQDGNLQVVSGSGFQIVAGSDGSFTISFDLPFAGPPAVSIQLENGTASSTLGSNSLLQSSADNLKMSYWGRATFSGSKMHVIAIGPR